MTRGASFLSLSRGQVWPPIWIPGLAFLLYALAPRDMSDHQNEDGDITDTPISEQLGQRYQHYVLCLECQAKLEGDRNWALAIFGPQGLTDEEAVLVCVPFEEAALKHISQEFACDGCGAIVAVAPSSRWFIERHKKERVGS